MSTTIQRETALKYIEHFIGLPYRWGGDDPSGFDCSGLAVEYLKCLGVIPKNSDFNAQGLARILRIKARAQRGDLVFFGESVNAITHVEIMIDPLTCIGASGGGRHIKNADLAWQHNAYIKCRPLKYGGRNPIATRYAEMRR